MSSYNDKAVSKNDVFVVFLLVYIQQQLNGHTYMLVS